MAVGVGVRVGVAVGGRFTLTRALYAQAPQFVSFQSRHRLPRMRYQSGATLLYRTGEYAHFPDPATVLYVPLRLVERCSSKR